MQGHDAFCSTPQVHLTHFQGDDRMANGSYSDMNSVSHERNKSCGLRFRLHDRFPTDYASCSNRWSGIGGSQVTCGWRPGGESYSAVAWLPPISEEPNTQRSNSVNLLILFLLCEKKSL
jgi:hypothetical protein